MTELITYIFEIITMIVSFFTSILVFNKRKYTEVSLGNIFLSLAFACLGFYALATVIYSIIGQAWAVILFLKLGMIAVTISVLLLFYTMQTLINSSKWIRMKKFTFFIPLLICIIIIVIIITTDYIEVIDAKTAETHFEPITYNIYVIFIAFMLIYSAFSLYYFGIRKSTGESRNRMMFFFIGLLVIIGALITDAIGNVIENEVLFDTLLFGLLALGIILITLAFISRKKNNNST